MARAPPSLRTNPSHGPTASHRRNSGGGTAMTCEKTTMDTAPIRAMRGPAVTATTTMRASRRSPHRRAGWMAAVRQLATASVLLAAPAFAIADELDSGDTAWMITATALVLLMTIPGLSLFYAGMVRSKNVLSVLSSAPRCSGSVGSDSTRARSSPRTGCVHTRPATFLVPAPPTPPRAFAALSPCRNLATSASRSCALVQGHRANASQACSNRSRFSSV